MIPEVVPGQKISAKTQNEIIQACNGLMQPAGEFVNTPNGSLYPNPMPKFNNMLGRCVETMFQLKFELKQHMSNRIADEQSQTLSDEYSLSSIWYGYSVNLGNDFAELKDQIKLMQPDNDDIFVIGGKGINGSGDSENGNRLSVHLVGSQMLIDGSDKEGFFDLGIYWKSPSNGCHGIEVQKLQLSTDNPQQGPIKNAFVIRGKNYPSQSIIKDWYEDKYSGEWKVTESEVATLGYVYDQKLVQLRTGLLFPQTAKVWVDSQISSVELSSIQERSLSDFAYHQMFNFDQPSLSNFMLSDQYASDIVIRDYNRDRVPVGAAVNYVKVHDFLSATRYDVDTDATQGAQRSVEVIPHGGDIKRDYLQLYDFNNGFQEEYLHCTLTYGCTRYVVKPDHDSSYGDSRIQFLVRDNYTGNDVLVYDGIEIYAPPIGASDITDLCSVISDLIIEIDPGHECSCDISALSAKVDEISAELSDRWKCGGTYDDNCYGQSIGDNSMNLAIDIDNGQLWYGSSMTLDWHACELYDQNGASGPGNICMNWQDRCAYGPEGSLALDWSYRLLRDEAGMPTVDWQHQTLDSDYGPVLDWYRQYLLDNQQQVRVDWNGCFLNDTNEDHTVNWHFRTLIGGWTVIDGSGAGGCGGFTIQNGCVGLTIGCTNLTEPLLQELLQLSQQAPSMLQSL